MKAEWEVTGKSRREENNMNGNDREAKNETFMFWFNIIIRYVSFLASDQNSWPITYNYYPCRTRISIMYSQREIINIINWNYHSPRVLVSKSPHETSSRGKDGIDRHFPKDKPRWQRKRKSSADDKKHRWSPLCATNARKSPGYECTFLLSGQNRKPFTY